MWHVVPGRSLHLNTWVCPSKKVEMEGEQISNVGVADLVLKNAKTSAKMKEFSTLDRGR